MNADERRFWEEGAAALTEARDIYSKFAERDPAQYGPYLRR